MKKLLTLSAIFIVMMISASCGIKNILPPRPDLASPYRTSFTACMTFIPAGESPDKEEKFTFGGEIMRLGGGFWEMYISSPETLSGLKITASGDSISSDLEGLSIDSDIADIPERSPVKAIFDALDTLALRFENGAVLTPSDNGNFSYQDEGLSAVFDPDGVLMSMAIAHPSITVEFTDFTAYRRETEAISETAYLSETTASAETSADTHAETTEAPQSETVTTVIFYEHSSAPVTAE